MATLLEKLREQRTFWVELDEKRAVQLRRPLSDEQRFVLDLANSYGAGVSEVIEQCSVVARRFVVGWKGFTEAFILGPEIGAKDPVDFDAEVWAELVRDRSDWSSEIGVKLIQAWNAAQEKQEAITKN